MVATRPGGPPAPDAYVACPVCGGKIHPIAGRCKHCKSDLVALRAASAIPTPMIGPHASAPAPVAPLTGAAVQSSPVVAPVVPPISGAASAPVSQYAPPGSGPLNAAAFAPVAAAAMPVATAMTTTYAQPGGHAGSGVVRGSQWGRRWPILVVVLAAAAIVVSIVLLVMPEEDASAGSRIHGAPPPTPDHMNTNPIPQGPDPWGMAPQVQPSNPSPSDPDDDDLWGSSVGGGGVGGGGTGLGIGPVPAPSSDEFLSTLGSTFCRKLASCPGSGITDDECDQLGSLLGSTVLPGVSACGSYDRSRASTCLTTISRFPCTTAGQLEPDQMKALIAGIPACIDACSP